jgi:ribosomal protein S18 acetylase RimI-like enzyme
LAVVCRYAEQYRVLEPTDAGTTQRDAAIEQLIQSQLMGNSIGYIWLIEWDRQPVGYVALAIGFSLAFGGRDGFLDELYVDPQYRGQGIGTRVLREVLNEARSLDLHAVHLEVSRDNPRARALYQREGFADRQHYHLMSCLLRGDGSTDKG